MEAIWIACALLLRLSLWLQPVLPAGSITGNSLLMAGTDRSIH
jgi:hypothetical protein